MHQIDAFQFPLFPRRSGIVGETGIDLKWSGRRDLNSRPLAPQASALPGCATSRWNPLPRMTMTAWGSTFQILHSAAATMRTPALTSMRNSLSQTEGDGYHHAATASRGNMIAWQYLVPWPGDEFYGGRRASRQSGSVVAGRGRPALHLPASWNDARVFLARLFWRS